MKWLKILMICWIFPSLIESRGLYFNTHFLSHRPSESSGLLPKPVSFSVQKKKSFESLSSMLSRSINGVALLYASWSLYKRYAVMRVIGPSHIFGKTIGPYTPQSICTLGAAGIFFIDAVAIIARTLLYKTLAQLLLYCGTSNPIEKLFKK